jgi:hypothetical protein
MDIEDEELEPATSKPVKFHWVFVLAHLTAFLTNMAMAHRVFWAGITDEISNHNAHVIARDEFAASAGAEIERLVKGEVDG